jgi:chloride channel protein, CIC family
MPEASRSNAQAIERARHLGDFTLSARVIQICTLALAVGFLAALAAWCLLRLIGLFTNLFFHGRAATRPIAPGEAILTRGSRIEPRIAVLKPISAAIPIGSGGPFGAEGPIIMTGGAVGSVLAQHLELTADERKTLLGGGRGRGGGNGGHLQCAARLGCRSAREPRAACSLRSGEPSARW